MTPTPRSAVRVVRTADDVVQVRLLLLEYREWLATHREVTAFDDAILRKGLDAFDQEISRLPGEYGPPSGALLLAREGTTPIGCGALRPVAPKAAEFKRLYVRPDYRGRDLGRRITQKALVQAHTLGYDRVLLDTLPTMTAAIALYRKMGFVAAPRYWAHPVPGALFFEYPLRRGGDTPARATE